MTDSFVVDKEIINSFQEEANGLLEELRDVIDRLEEKQENFPKALLEEFGNKTDRIMGTATTFSKMCPGQPVFIQMGKFCELCKVTSYKAATLNNISLIPIFTAFWADTVDILQDLVTHVESPSKVKEVTRGYVPVLQKRLVWLAGQIVALTKGQDGSSNAVINVDGLLKKMGLDV
jgi:hypothetical protein